MFHSSLNDTWNPKILSNLIDDKFKNNKLIIDQNLPRSIVIFNNLLDNDNMKTNKSFNMDIISILNHEINKIQDTVKHKIDIRLKRIDQISHETNIITEEYIAQLDLNSGKMISSTINDFHVFLISGTNDRIHFNKNENQAIIEFDILSLSNDILKQGLLHALRLMIGINSKNDNNNNNYTITSEEIKQIYQNLHYNYWQNTLRILNDIWMISEVKPSSFYLISETYQKLFLCMKNALQQKSNNDNTDYGILTCVEIAKSLHSRQNELTISIGSPWEQTIAIFSPFWFPIMLPLFRR